MIQHTFGLLVKPGTQWRTIAALPESTLRTLLLYPCILAILPAVAWYYGTTVIGWTVGDYGEPIRLTRESARQICILFYLTMVACVAIIGYSIHWMAATYGAKTTVTRGIVLAGFAATPLFIAGLTGFHPHTVAGYADWRGRTQLGCLPDVSGYSHCHEYPTKSVAFCSPARCWPLPW